MSAGSEGPPSQSAKPMPAIQEFRVLATDNPNLIGLGFVTPIGSVLLAADHAQVLEMIAKLQQVADRMREPS